MPLLAPLMYSAESHMSTLPLSLRSTGPSTLLQICIDHCGLTRPLRRRTLAAINSAINVLLSFLFVGVYALHAIATSVTYLSRSSS